MTKILCSLFVFLVFGGRSFSANLEDSLTARISAFNSQGLLSKLVLANPSIKLTDFNYSYDNPLNETTLKSDEIGDLTLTWENSNVSKSFIYVQYRPLGQKEWKSKVVPNQQDVKIILFDLPENTIFESRFGASDSPDVLYHFDSTIHYINSFTASLFKNNSAKGQQETAEISWAIPYDQLTQIIAVYPNASFSLKYNTDIGVEQNNIDSTKSPWILIDDISLNEVARKLENLIGGAEYTYLVGLKLTDETTIWTKPSNFTVDRSWGLFGLLVLIGSLGLFIYGMKIMSEGLQKAAGSKLRSMLSSITSNRLKGVLSGFGITAIIQSSSVTTVMTVSFVNAGLITLRQSAGVMMGANIGTTITAWLILMFGFKVNIEEYALIFIAIGAPMLFFGKGKIRTWAGVIIGFSIFFMGLGFLKNIVPEIGPDSSFIYYFIGFKDAWYGTLVFVALGTVITMIIQSSSAAMALTMTMVASGILPFELAAAMILGENIGTTITAELASLVGNVHAKRSARIHSLFNIIGVSWAIFALPLMIKGITYLFLGGADPAKDFESANLLLAIFHSAFNTLNVLLLLPFVPWLIKLSEITVKSKGVMDEEYHLDFIGAGIMGTADLSISEAKKEIAKFGELTSRMSEFTQELFTEQNKKTKIKLHEKIAKYEEITDRIEIEVATYLSKVSEGEMSEETAENVRSMNSIANDLERIGDIFYQMSKTIEKKDENKIWFLPEQRVALIQLFILVDQAFKIMIQNLNDDWKNVSIHAANEIEMAINKKRDEMRESHLSNMGSIDFSMEKGMIYNDLFASCEKIGDHIINVSEAITGKI
jgi:phosphate:Na+ symporter